MSQSLQPFESTVVKTIPLTPRVKCVRFECPPGHAFGLIAGQHIQVLMPTAAGTRKGTFSVASSPHEQFTFELCVTLQEGSLLSAFIHHLKVGERVHVVGPLGGFRLNPALDREVVFVATGSGIAPIRSMIMDLAHRKFNKSVTLLFGNHSEDDILFKDDWNRLEKTWPLFHVNNVLSRPSDSWAGTKGRVHEVLEKVVRNLRECEFYLCGQPPMVASVREKLSLLNVSPAQVHYEGPG